MNQRLIYVMGPSGAGKDSLLEWLRNRLPAASPVHFARRTIDRPLQAEGEQHESVDTASFDSLRDSNAFALHWLANGRQYGVRHCELQPLRKQDWVLVNGSRAHLVQVLRDFEGMNVLHISASADVLRARLLARGRESPEAIEARVQRSVRFDFEPSARVISLLNDSSIESAGAEMLKSLALLPGWPAI